MRRPIDEADIFKPLSKSDTDDNEWPIFPLKDAVVISQATNETAALILANEANPVTVTGLVPSLERAQRHHLIDRDSVPANIILPSVQRFSYGQYQGGEVAFWAGSRSGWFELAPSRRYRPIFKEMAEAINILYFVADLFHDMSKKQIRQTSAETLFEKYAQDDTFECQSSQQARKLFVQHREALVTLMSQGKEGIAWKGTAIYKFLRETSLAELSDGEEFLPSTPKPKEEDASSDDDLPRHLARKGKSALRLKSGAAGKGAGRQNMNLDEAEDDVEMTDAVPYSQVPPLRRKSEENISSRPSKRRRGRPPRNQPAEADPPPPLPEPTRDIDDMRDSDNVPLPFATNRTKAQAQKSNRIPTHRVDILSTLLPTFEANQPGDVWSCSFDGCVHRIFGASTEQSKALIEEHYKFHAQDSQAQLDLVYQEERPYLPVGNLIKKIRDIAAHQKAGAIQQKDPPKWKTELMDYPKPIARKY